MDNIEDKIIEMSNITDVRVSFGNGKKRYVTVGLSELKSLIELANGYAKGEAIDSCIAIIEEYFKDLIVIPDPQKTKENLIGYFYSIKPVIQDIKLKESSL